MPTTTLTDKIDYAVNDNGETITLHFQDISSLENLYTIELTLPKRFQGYWRSERVNTELYQRLSDRLVNIPYVDTPEYYAKCDHMTIYRPNHDTGHGLRQLVNSQFLLDTLREYGSEGVKQAAQELNSEETAAILLAAFLFRVGRTNERGGKQDPTNARRSAQLFELMAKALGFQEQLAESIAFCVANHAPIYDAKLCKMLSSTGLTGEGAVPIDKSQIIKGVLDLSHHSDLVRLYANVDDINSNNLLNLARLFSEEHVKCLNEVLLNLNRINCELTGTSYYYHDESNRMRTPPLKYKAEAVTDVHNTLRELEATRAKAIDCLQMGEIQSFMAYMADAQQWTTAKTEEAVAADTINRAWRKKRTYNQANITAGIHPEAVSTNNIKRLRVALAANNRKRKTKEPIEFVNTNWAPKQGENSIFSPAEQRLFDYLIHKFEWTLKHVTPHYPSIKANGNMLKSVPQRQRENHLIEACYTDNNDGRKDNVFFTIGSPNGWPAEFLQAARGHEIRIPLRKFLDKNLAPKDNLMGLWASASWYAFRTQRTAKSRIGDTSRVVSYIKNHSDAITLSQADYKWYQYQKPGTPLVEEKKYLGEETVTGRDILPFLAMNVIRELRQMDKAFRRDCLKEPKGQLVEAFIDTIYEQRNFEVLLPAKLDLTDPRIELRAFNQSIQDSPENAMRMKVALDSQNIEAIKALLDEGVPVEIDVRREISPLGYVLSEGYEINESMAAFLIDHGANIQRRVKYYSPLTYAVMKQSYRVARKILCTGVIDQRTPRIRRLLDINNEKDAIKCAFIAQDRHMLALFLDYGMNLSQFDHDVLDNIVSQPELAAMDMVSYLARSNFNFLADGLNNKAHHYNALKQCVLLNKNQLLERLLQAGIQVNCHENQQSLLTLAEKLNYQECQSILKAFGAVSFEGAKNKDVLNYVLFVNDARQILVSRTIQPDGSPSNYYQSLLIPGSNLDEALIRLCFLSASGISLAHLDYEKVIETEANHQSVCVYQVILPKELGDKASNTESNADWKWIGRSDLDDVPLDSLSKSYVTGESGFRMHQLLSRTESLFQAIEDDDPDTVNDLLQLGIADLEQKALINSCDRASPNLTIVEKLIDAGYQVNRIMACQETSYTPLSLAILNRHLPLIRLLIDRGAKINQPLGPEKVSPMMLAASLNQIDTLALLEQKGADYHHPNNCSILAFACFNHCSDLMFDYLIERVDCDSPFVGYTPLVISALGQKEKRVEKLLKKGVDTKIRCPNTHRFASDIMKNKSIFRRYEQSETQVKNTWTDLREVVDSHLYIAGKLNHPHYEQLLPKEFAINLISQDDANPLSYLYCLLPEDQIGEVRLAIAQDANLPVFTCAGFNPPVIAIAKAYLMDYAPSIEKLRFALHHEVAYLAWADDKQLSFADMNKRAEFDQTAFQACDHIHSVIGYLRNVDAFYKQHLNQDNFTWPKCTIKGKSLGYEITEPFAKERIKVMKLDSRQHVKTAERHDLPEKILEAVGELDSFDYFPDFPIAGSQELKYDYLYNNLSSLADEFLPFDTTERPSARLKQFVILCLNLPLTESQVDNLLIEADRLKTPGFQYLYLRLLGYSGYRQDISCTKIPARGPFKIVQQSMLNFRDNTQNSQEINRWAENLLQSVETIKAHWFYPAVLETPYDNYVKENGCLPEHPFYCSMLGNDMVWPGFEKPEDASRHIRLAIKQKNGPIWRALWMMGLSTAPAFYKAVPRDILLSYSRSRGSLGVSSHECNYDDALVPPVIVRLKGDAREDGIEKINQYLSRTIPVIRPDFSSLSESSIDAFITANCYHFYPGVASRNSRKAVNDLLCLFDALFEQANPLSQQSVRTFFQSCANTKGYTLKKIIGDGRCLSNRSPFYDYLINTSIFTSIEKLDLLYQYFDYDLFPYQHIAQLFKHLPGSDDDFETFLYLLKLIVERYGNYHSAHIFFKSFIKDNPVALFSQSGYQFITYFNQNDSLSTFLSMVFTKLSPNWAELATSGLKVDALIVIYRLLDSHWQFPDPCQQELMGELIINQVKQIPEISLRCHLLQQLLFINDSPSSKTIVDRKLANQAIQLWAESMSELMDKDDASQAYCQKGRMIVRSVYSNSATRDAVKMLSKLCQMIESQETLSHYIGCLYEPEKNEDYVESRLNHYESMTQVLSILGEEKQDKIATLDFFASAVTAASLDTFADYIFKNPRKRQIEKCLTDESERIDKKMLRLVLRALHQDFWDFNLEERAVILDSLIITTKDEADEEREEAAYQAGFEYVTTKLFPEAANNSREAFALALLTAYLKTADKNKRQFLLAGLLVTTHESDGEKTSIGKKFALLCEHLGPAYVKLAQAVHSHPDTPTDVKSDLEHIKGRANPPHRWQLWRLIREVLPRQDIGSIKRIGQLLGSASYNLALALETATDSDQVLLLLRENAAAEAKEGFAHLFGTIEQCDHPLILDSKQSFLNMIEEAQLMSDAEIDSALGDKQHQIAKALYSDTTIKVEVAGECYSVHFQPCDSLASGTGYRRLTKMKGIEFNDFVDPSEEQPLRKAIALAVCEKELQILFSGGYFDADRHGCQLRVDVEGRDIYLGLYDFGEMSLEPLTDAEIHSFALLLKDFPKAIKQNENIANLFERHIRQAMENDQPYRHLMRINKALLALNDFRQALDNREIASIIQKISGQIEPRLYRALREGQLNTITLSDYPKFIWHQVDTFYASTTAKLGKPFGLM